MVIHGGKGSSNDLKEAYLSDMWVFNTVKKTWSEVLYDQSVVAAFHAGVVYEGKLLIFGGKKSDKIKQQNQKGNVLYEFEFRES